MDSKEEPSTLMRSGMLLTNIPTPTAEYTVTIEKYYKNIFKKIYVK